MTVDFMRALEFKVRYFVIKLNGCVNCYRCHAHTQRNGSVGEYSLKKSSLIILWDFLMYMRPLILKDFLMYYLLCGFLMYRDSFSIIGLSYVQLVCKIRGFSPCSYCTQERPIIIQPLLDYTMVHPCTLINDQGLTH